MRIVLKITRRKFGRQAELQSSVENASPAPEPPTGQSIDQEPEKSPDQDSESPAGAIESRQTRWVHGTGWTDDPR